MTKRMLIDARYPEETRVVVMDGNRLEEFDLETAHRRPLKGNIYLAKVVRVEPSLQAAFVDYGGNRHGFLAFSEIHPDYYQIPVADRQRLLEMQAAEARAEAEAEEEEALRAEAGHAEAAEGKAEAAEAEAEAEAAAAATGEAEATGAAPAGAAPAEAPAAAPPLPAGAAQAEAAGAAEPPAEGAEAPAGAGGPPGATPPVSGAMPMTRTDDRIRGTVPPDAAAEAAEDHMAPAGAVETVTLAGTTAPAAGPAPSVPPAAEAPAAEASAAAPETAAEAFPAAAEAEAGRGEAEDRLAETAPEAPAGAGEGEAEGGARDDSESEPAEELPPPPETLGGEGAAADAEEEARRERRIPPRFLRQYKIQEVIKRRQIMLVQVVKEERGSKGAALTTYISLAGRFSVLMPNSPRGGGVSRKITSAADRKRLREIIDELGLPEGMSLIIRTAGANRPKAEIKRDCEYLLRLWDSIRERTLQSTAPALIYEEADLIKRSIRDVYGRDIEEIIVEGEDAYREAREFMRMLMPSHVRKIQLYRDPVPLFVRYGVEQQLEAMYSPVVQLKSGGTIVIHQTEALVAIDVNSGRATRDRHIEDTALKVNLEAADEIARQLRLRDLAGLIVIDFIDMESAKHDAMVERRLKEALKHDRARIQVGRISHFGLLEMSRQRLRPSLAEHAFVTCSYCQGRGQVRSIESSALAVLRAIEEEGAKRRAAEIAVRVAQPLALFLLNRRRDRLAAIEARYNMRVTFEVDDTLVPPALRIERVRPQTAALPGAESPAPSAALRMDYAPEPEEAEEAAEPAAEEAAPEAAGEAAPAEAEPVRAAGEAEGEGAKRRRRRRRRRSGRREEGGAPLAAERAAEGAPAEPGEEEYEEEQAAAEATAPGEAEQPAAAAEEEAEGRPGEDEEEGEERRNGGRRRRGRRGGRRRRPELESEAVARGRAGPERLASEAAASAPPPAVAQPAAAPPAARYGGPTPADPFAGHIEDIYEAMAAAEAAAEAAAAARRASPPEASPAAPQSAPEAAAAAPFAPPPVAVTPEPAAPPAPPAAGPAEAPPGLPAPATPAAAGGGETAAVTAPPPAAPQEPRIGPPILPRLIDEEPPEAAAQPKRRGYWRR